MGTLRTLFDWRTAVSALAIVMAGVLITTTIQSNASVSEVKRLQERTDCARRLNAEQVAVRDLRDQYKAELDSAFISALLLTAADPNARSAVLVELKTRNDALVLALEAVNKLPDLDRLVAKRCTSTI